MSEETILIVEDDEYMRELIYIYLQKERFRLLTTGNGYQAVDLVIKEKPDLIVLDVVLPGLDGFEVCHEVRKVTDIPILFLSSKDGDIDKVLGLGIGGDDYMTKPFSPSELTARVKAHLRRNRVVNQQVQTEEILKYDKLVINLSTCTVTVNEQLINLSTKEFQMLTLFAKHPNKVYSMENLYSEIWKMDSMGDPRTVMVHISNLRKKIENDPNHPEYIQTVRGIGYKFVGVKVK